MTTDERVLVFVYGSLMQGQSNAHHMPAGSFVRRARTGRGWALVSLGPWPALVVGDGQVHGRVHGEVHAVPTAELPRLDAFEDVPDLYVRRAIALDDGTEVDAWVMPARRAQLGEPVPGGDWRDARPTSGPPRIVWDDDTGYGDETHDGEGHDATEHGGG